ncbi:MAG: DNA circularization N-terminal domain-containing protein [Vibrio sp.]
MWERQYEHGRWNGHQLNILSTAIDGGQRLHVSEIPYADLPHIRVMGSKARSIKLDVVFVGISSLADSNNFIEALHTSPVGELEHPWLGELPLVFDSFSQNISTKRGIVTLGLSFVRAGAQPSINAIRQVRSKQLAATAETASTSSFSNDVSKLSTADINQLQSNYTSALDTLTDITHRINTSIDQVQSLVANNPIKEAHRAINAARAAVSRLAQQPGYFSNLFSSAASAVSIGVQSIEYSEGVAIDSSRTAQTLLLDQVSDSPVLPHYNIQIAIAAIKVSKDLAAVETEDEFDVTESNTQADIIKADFSALIESLEHRIEEVTTVSTMESLELFDALTALKSGVQTQLDKVVNGTGAHRVIQLPRFKPALVIAHEQFTNKNLITAINTLQHPLFMRGEIAVRNNQ